MLIGLWVYGLIGLWVYGLISDRRIYKLDTGFRLWALRAISLGSLESLVLFVSAFASAFVFALTSNSPPSPLFLSCDLWYENDFLKRGES